MRGALSGVDGIGRIEIEEGQRDFVVHYDDSKIQPARMIELLHAKGEKKAKLKT